MNFEEYSILFKLRPFHNTEQSLVFLVERESVKRVCKKPSSMLDLKNELLAYEFIKRRSLISIPEITEQGDDFFEMAFVDGGIPTTRQIIRGIAEMYSSTFSLQDIPFSSIDLSEQKLQHRLNYIPEELRKRDFEAETLIQRARSFVTDGYDVSAHSCLVHGDLKSPHTIESQDEIFYLDLALFGKSTPWYDLAFIYMEQTNKPQAFSEVSSCTNDCLGDSLRISERDIKSYLKSAIFYRCVYNVIFASRHRNDKSLIRTLGELEEILNTKIY